MLPKLTICVVLLSLAVAVPAGATIITVDDFTSDTRDGNWVQSTILPSGGGGGTYTFDTTTVDNELTVSMSGHAGSTKHEALLRSDYSLGVGETLLTDLTGATLTSGGSAGLLIGTATGITSREDVMFIVYVPMYGDVGMYYIDHTNNQSKNKVKPGSMPDALYIARTATNIYEGGYYMGTTPTAVWTVTVDTASGNLLPGEAIGYSSWISSNLSSANFDNFRLDVIPEPSTLVLLGMGMVGLLAYAWRRRK